MENLCTPEIFFKLEPQAESVSMAGYFFVFLERSHNVLCSPIAMEVKLKRLYI